LGPTILLESGRLGREITMEEYELKRKIFLDNCGQVTCEHGERARSIQAWNQHPERKRDTLCDCVSTLYLQPRLKECNDPTCICSIDPKKYASFSYAKRVESCKGNFIIPPSEWPCFSQSVADVFDVLKQMGRPIHTSPVTGKPQCFAFKSASGEEVHVRESGEPVCKHGKSSFELSMSRSGRRNFTVTCDCKPSLPRRDGCVMRLTGKKRKENDFVKGDHTSDIVKLSKLRKSWSSSSAEDSIID
jgi:hypothetical protein